MLTNLFDLEMMDPWTKHVVGASKRFVIKRLPIGHDSEFEDAAKEVTINVLFGQSPFFSTLLFVDYDSPDYISLVLERSDLNLKSYASRTDESHRAKVFQKLTTDLLSALSLLHSAKICHFDIKPANVLVDEGAPPSFKLIDFGLSAFPTDQFYLLNPVFTSTYRAPEMLVSPPRISEMFAGDMWALGVTLHNFLFDEPLIDPFVEETEYLEIIREATDTKLDHAEFRDAVSRRAYEGRIETGVELISSLLTISPKERPTASSLLVSPPLYRFRDYIRRAPPSIMEPLTDSLEKAPTAVKVAAYEIATRYCGCLPDSEITSPLLVAKAAKVLAYAFDNCVLCEPETEMVRPMMKQLGVVINPGLVPVANRAVRWGIDPSTLPLNTYERPLRLWFD